MHWYKDVMVTKSLWYKMHWYKILFNQCYCFGYVEEMQKTTHTINKSVGLRWYPCCVVILSCGNKLINDINGDRPPNTESFTGHSLGWCSTMTGHQCVTLFIVLQHVTTCYAWTVGVFALKVSLEQSRLLTNSCGAAGLRMLLSWIPTCWCQILVVLHRNLHALTVGSSSSPAEAILF